MNYSLPHLACNLDIKCRISEYISCIFFKLFSVGHKDHISDLFSYFLYIFFFLPLSSSFVFPPIYIYISYYIHVISSREQKVCNYIEGKTSYDSGELRSKICSPGALIGAFD